MVNFLLISSLRIATLLILLIVVWLSRDRDRFYRRRIDIDTTWLTHRINIDLLWLDNEYIVGQRFLALSSRKFI